MDQNIITVNAASWAGKQIRVTYLYTKNRIDSILMSTDGVYRLEKGIVSTSPSHVDMIDYPGYMLIGAVEIVIGNTVTMRVFDGLREYRKVYVDPNNRLYLNGKLYREQKFIYFVEPEKPAPDDIWYDSTTNTLMIWVQRDGKWGWVQINETHTVPLTEKKIWSAAECPSDNQTFLFANEDIHLRYIPNNNELEIIIDNAILMSDQYEEIIMPDADKVYLSTGIGFKLKSPLDRATFVECRVHHSVQFMPLKKTFQRAAMFVNENYSYHNTLNTAQIFHTDASYVLGEQQLEVFVNGVRLVKDISFKEMLDDAIEATATHKGTGSTTFKVTDALTSGQRVEYKITKHVYSYDHLNAMVEDIETKADNALAKANQVEADLTQFNTNVTTNLATINTNISTLATQMGGLNNYVKKTDQLAMTNMPDGVTQALFAEAFQAVVQATTTNQVNGCKITDFLLVFYISAAGTKLLLKDIDYTILEATDGILVVLKNSTLVNSANSLCLTGIKTGVSA